MGRVIRSMRRSPVRIENAPVDYLHLDLLSFFEEFNPKVPFSQGLSPERIKNFEHFTADESLVGEKCLICMSDLEIGMEMVRLDCHVDHFLCKKCTDNWFKNHNTCPSCRNVFN